MKLLKKNIPFFLALTGMIFGWWYVMDSTRDAPSWDGIASEGFPFVYHSWGGFCMDCPATTNYWVLILDVMLTIALPACVQLLWNFLRARGKK